MSVVCNLDAGQKKYAEVADYQTDSMLHIIAHTFSPPPKKQSIPPPKHSDNEHDGPIISYLGGFPIYFSFNSINIYISLTTPIFLFFLLHLLFAHTSLTVSSPPLCPNARALQPRHIHVLRDSFIRHALKPCIASVIPAYPGPPTQFCKYAFVQQVKINFTTVASSTDSNCQRLSSTSKPDLHRSQA